MVILKRLAVTFATVIVVGGLSSPAAAVKAAPHAVTGQNTGRVPAWKLDKDKQVRGWLALARKGDAGAMDELGNHYYFMKMPAEGLRWRKAALAANLAAASRGDAEAMDDLAYRYHEGLGVTKSEAEADRWAKAATAAYRAAAERGEPAAMEALAGRYYGGTGVEENDQESERWERAAAAEYAKRAHSGQASAMVRLGELMWSGELLRSGIGVPQDDEQALRWFRAAAAKGDLNAVYNLYRAYERGDGAKQDFTEAARWTAVAAKAGVRKSMYQLALDYDTGHGVPPDRVLATRWFQAAAKKGHPAAITALRDPHFRTVLRESANSSGKSGVPGTRCATLKTRAQNLPPSTHLEVVSSKQYPDGLKIKLRTIAGDPEGDHLTYTYSGDSGRIEENGAFATWTLTQPGAHTVTVEVSDKACVAFTSITSSGGAR